MKSTTKTTSEFDKMSKSALRTFGGLSLVVYSFALGYCYYTGNFLAFGIIGTVMLVLGVLLAIIYKSM